MSRRVIGRLRASRPGQVVVEMLLILPVFLTIVFTIMELGYISFWMIVLNHSTYEVARVGALLSTPAAGGDPVDVNYEMQRIMNTIIRDGRAFVSSEIEQHPFEDPQARVRNSDLVVTGSYRLQLIFPISSILLARPRGSGRRVISTTVRMPIERPLQS
ncbi:MAG: pilus assembly protein [Elusimicrobia bacterium]|nr:pilus assembly protein [Elusimicrobiota bacterium]